MRLFVSFLDVCAAASAESCSTCRDSNEAIAKLQKELFDLNQQLETEKTKNGLFTIWCSSFFSFLLFGYFFPTESEIEVLEAHLKSLRDDLSQVNDVNDIRLPLPKRMKSLA